MSLILWIILPFYAAIVLMWLAAALFTGRLGGDASMRLSPEPDLPADAGAPSLAIFVAAHNEEARIDACLARLLSQNYAHLSVIVANDRSVDATGERVKAAMAADSRVSLVEIERLPPGWIGKTHALSRAAAGVEADYFLFVDCDCRLSPGAIAAIMRKVVAEEIEFASLWPYLELKSRAERILTPAVSWLLALWTMIDGRAGADGSRMVLGNGQFMLFSRRAYELVGTHAVVADELAEDIILARRAAGLGLRHWAGWGRGLYISTRDNGWPAAANATTRVILGSLVTPWRLFASLHLLSGGVGSLALIALPAAVLAVTWPATWNDAESVWSGRSAAGIIGGLGLLHAMSMAYVNRQAFRMAFTRPPGLAAFVAGAIACMGLVARAWRISGGAGHVRWGRTRYRVKGSRIVGVVP